MSTSVHRLRRELRAAIGASPGVLGTFVKLPAPDVIEQCAAAAGLDFVVVDMEHSTLSEAEAISLVRTADLCGLAALVRLPALDAGVANRLLENGAVGIQLSMMQTVEQVADLRNATRYAPAGRRSVSLGHRTADFGAGGLAAYLARERDDPPVIVGQIETARTDPLETLLPGLDVCFLGTTDLSVDLGVAPGDEAVRQVAARVSAAARTAGVAFGGWAPSLADVPALGLDEAAYKVIGTDGQILAGGLRALAPAKETSHE